MLAAGMSSTDSISAASHAPVAGRTGANVTPQLPSTTEVTPCQHDDVRVGIPRELRVEVGVDVDEAGRHVRAVGVDRPRARRRSTSPTSTMRSPSIATSPVKPARPVPSTIVPPRITRSCVIRARYLSGPCPVTDSSRHATLAHRSASVEGVRMDLGIAGRRAAVAAASKGLGFAVAQALAAEGVQVAMCGRDADTIAAAAENVGGDAVPIVADVSTPDGCGRVRARRARGARRRRHPRRQRGWSAARQLRERERRPVPRRVRAQLPFDDRDVLRGGARDARAAVGESGRDHVDRGAPTDRRAHPLEHRARRA